MREIIYVEKSTVTQDGRRALAETRCHGLLGEDGVFRLLACCGKRFPLQSAATPVEDRPIPAPKQDNAA